MFINIFICSIIILKVFYFLRTFVLTGCYNKKNTMQMELQTKTRDCQSKASASNKRSGKFAMLKKTNSSLEYIAMW